MAGPTGGYLAGFLVAAVLIGWLADSGYGRTIFSAIAIFAVGEFVRFALGVGWFTALIGMEKAIFGGLIPFIPAEILKMALACAILTLASKRTKT